MAYNLFTKYAMTDNCGGTRTKDQIKYLVFHYTGNHGDTARSNAFYFASQVVKASAHYFVDDTSVWQSVDDLRVAWSVGGNRYINSKGGSMYGVVTNTNSISIEMCGTGISLEASEKTIQNAMDLARDLMHKYNIPIQHVYRHYDVTGKSCPAWLVADSAWSQFKSKLQEQKQTEEEAAVSWALSNSIFKGNTSGDLMLNEVPTRRQLLLTLYRLYKSLQP